MRLVSIILFSLLLSSAAQSQAQGELIFKCKIAEECGSLVETGCGIGNHSFGLRFDPNEGFIAEMYGVIWKSKKVKSPADRTDITSLILTEKTGEVALLTVDQDWRFSVSTHFTGQGKGVRWLSQSGTCEVIK